MTQPTDGTTPEPTAPHYAYPTPGQAPTPPAAPAAQGVTLAEDPAAPGNGGGSHRGLIIGGLVAALVLGGGAVFAAQKLSGGGAQPADVLPGDSYAYFRLDIDPSAGQKIAAVRFLSKFPELEEAFSGDGDPREKIWKEIAKKDTCAAKLDYAKDIEPWLGDRVGAAFRPGASIDEPNAVAALQVKDETKAKSTIASLAKCNGDQNGDKEPELFTKDGYVLFTDKGKADETLAAINKGTLAQNSTFTGDMSALGEQGIASMWMDMGGFMKDPSLAKDLENEDLPKEFLDLFKGRYAAALRFDASYIELAGIGRGLGLPKSKVDGNGQQLANLPDDTIGAFHLGGGDKTIEDAWPTVKTLLDAAADQQGLGTGDDLLKQAEEEFGIKLPADLKVLLGSQLTVALPDQDFGGSSMPTVGLKIVSSDAKRADELIGTLEDAASSSGVLTRKVDGDKVYAATTSDYADKLKAGGKLGDTEAFKATLGDVSAVNQAWFVNLDKIEKHYLREVPKKYRPAVEALRAVGFSTTYTGPGEASFSFRIASN